MNSHEHTQITLITINDFLSKNSQINNFQSIFGDDYFEKASDLWLSTVNSFKSNTKLEITAKEIIFCMEYDYVLGPSIGVPENMKIEFYQWLFMQMEKLSTT